VLAVSFKILKLLLVHRRTHINLQYHRATGICNKRKFHENSRHESYFHHCPSYYFIGLCSNVVSIIRLYVFALYSSPRVRFVFTHTYIYIFKCIYICVCGICDICDIRDICIHMLHMCVCVRAVFGFVFHWLNANG